MKKKNKVTYEENQEKKHINKRPPPSRKPPSPIFSHLFRKRNGKHLLRTRARRKNSEENSELVGLLDRPSLSHLQPPSQNPIPGARCFLTAVYLIQGGPAVKLSRFQPAFRALHRGGAACPAPLWFCLPAHGCPALLARASYPSNRKLVGGIW